MPPVALRDYQSAAVEEAAQRNLLVVLPTNAGKTIISAKLIENVLYAENERGSGKKIVFLAPGRALAVQQARVLEEQIGPLQEEPTSVGGAAWRLGLVVGMGGLGLREAVRSRQVLVMTPQLFEKALIHAMLRMEGVALLVLDEAHHMRGNDRYATIMKYFYLPCGERPRVLALTASPVEKAHMVEPDAATFRTELAELEGRLDCAAWSRRVPPSVVPHALPQLLPFGRAAAPSELVDGVRRGLARVWDDGTAAEAEEDMGLRGEGVTGAARVTPETEAALEGKEVEALRAAWGQCVDKIDSICGGGELGGWAYYHAAQMLVRDLGQGTSALSPCEERDEAWPARRAAVGGSMAHAELLSKWRRELQERLERLRCPPATEPASASPKLLALVQHLRETRPAKCIVFITRRAACRLLHGFLCVGRRS